MDKIVGNINYWNFLYLLTYTLKDLKKWISYFILEMVYFWSQIFGWNCLKKKNVLPLFSVTICGSIQQLQTFFFVVEKGAAASANSAKEMIVSVGVCGGGRSKEGAHLYSWSVWRWAPADRTHIQYSESRRNKKPLSFGARDFIRAGHITCEGASLLLFILTASDTRRPYQWCRNALNARGLDFVCGRWRDNGEWFLWLSPVKATVRETEGIFPAWK